MHLLLSILTALTVLSVPKDKVGTPVLYGSRIVDVNRAHGKVFAPGQRNPRPQVMEFVRRDSVLMLVPDRPPRRRGPGPRPVIFPIVEETADAFAISLEPYFSTYPEEISAIPPKMLPGHAVEHELSCPSTPPEWLQVNGRYRYRDGLEVTAACYFLWLREKPLPPIDLDPAKVGYNSVEGRHPEGRFQRWDLTGGRKLDFYVDKTFPEAWYPYIQEGNTTSPLVNMVRYMDVEESNAKGDVLIDPRSGEILQGDILWWKNVVELMEGWRYVQTGAADPAARQAELPMEILGPMIRHAVCHEMGHVLGLNHNMGASWAYPADSLRSPSFTRKYGTTASVMDYARYNHLATAADVRAGVALLPPRLGPYDYYAIACGYGAGPAPEPGPYCYYAPMISAAISPDPSSQAESLGNDLLRSSEAGLRNCRALLDLDGLKADRLTLLRKYYYRYLSLALSNIGGVIAGEPVDEKTRNRTLKFIFDALDKVPAQLKDERDEQRILNELVGHFLPERILRTCGEKSLQRYGRELRRYARKHPRLPLKDEDEWIFNNQSSPL